MADRYFTTPAALHALLPQPDAPSIFDLRDAEDAAADPRAIPSARPIALSEIDDWRGPGPVICSCQKGGKLSQLAASALRARGIQARSLAGGHLAWCDAGLPLVLREQPARWVMPLDPDWDGLAALWLLRRLVDRDAPVRAVERSWLPKAAEVWDAVPLPPTPADLAEQVELEWPVADLTGGPDALLAGRLRRSDPVDALDLVDDWRARPGAAA